MEKLIAVALILLLVLPALAGIARLRRIGRHQAGKRPGKAPADD